MPDIYSLAKVIAIAGIAANLLGFIIYLAFTVNRGPVTIHPAAFGVWMTAFGIFYWIQLYFRTVQPVHKIKTHEKKILIAYLVLSILSLVAALIFFIGQNWDGALWGVVAFIANVLTLVVVRRKLNESGSDIEKALTAPGESANSNNNGQESASAIKRRCANCPSVCNSILIVFVILIQILILNGASILAGGMILYPPRGQFATYTLNDGTGRKQKILFECTGTKANENDPTVFLDSSASHGIADFWPLQREISERNIRVCIFDKPGLGYSDNYYADQVLANISVFYDPFLNATGEKAPYIIVGWGGGAANAMDYATAYPEKVSGLVVLDQYQENVDFRQSMEYYNFTAEQVKAAALADIDSRWLLFGLIRGLAVPWGIMGIFLNPDKTGYDYPERFNEYRWYYLTEKTWTTQYWYLKEERTHIAAAGVSNPPNKHPISLIQKKIPMLAIITNTTVDCTKIDPKYYKDPEEECKKQKFFHQYLFDDAHAAANITGNSRIEYCSDPKCDLGFALRFPELVATRIADHFNFLKACIKTLQSYTNGYSLDQI